MILILKMTLLTVKAACSHELMEVTTVFSVVEAKAFMVVDPVTRQCTFTQEGFTADPAPIMWFRHQWLKI
jgi:hypothetical protein